MSASTLQLYILLIDQRFVCRASKDFFNPTDGYHTLIPVSVLTREFIGHEKYTIGL